LHVLNCHKLSFRRLRFVPYLQYKTRVATEQKRICQNSYGQSSEALKILVSAVRFRPQPPSTDRVVEE